MFSTRNSDTQGGGYANLWWPLALGGGSVGVLLLLQLTPRPFLMTVTAILWLVALMTAAAWVQAREARMTARRGERVAWRTAGGATLLAAMLLVADPLLGKPVLAVALAAGLATSGLARLSIALARESGGRIWLFVSGAFTLAVAMMIGFGWPFPTVLPAVRALALDLLVLGAMLILAQTGGGASGPVEPSQSL
ncbi:hypothetical protein [Sphingopyxis fribergensis]